MVKKLCLVIVMMLLLTGCGGETEPVKKPVDDKPEKTKDAGYSFLYNGVDIKMNDKAAPIVEILGEPLEYFEAESCAFQGLDKTYYYSGFELHTYPIDGVDYVFSILFVDDSVSTPEGICLGSSLDDVIKAYGESYEEDMGMYTYTKGDSKLAFLIEHDVVSSIEYTAITE